MTCVWQSSIADAVRIMIHDFNEPYSFSDEYIYKSIVLGGLYSSREYSFSTDYTFDLVKTDIYPDPAAESTYDPLAIALFTLKAACIINNAQMQERACNSFRVRDGETEIDLSVSNRLFADIIKFGPCKTYGDLLLQAQKDKTANIGFAITTPISHYDLVSSPFSGIDRIYRAFV